MCSVLGPLYLNLLLMALDLGRSFVPFNCSQTCHTWDDIRTGELDAALAGDSSALSSDTNDHRSHMQVFISLDPLTTFPLDVFSSVYVFFFREVQHYNVDLEDTIILIMLVPSFVCGHPVTETLTSKRYYIHFTPEKS